MFDFIYSIRFWRTVPGNSMKPYKISEIQSVKVLRIPLFFAELFDPLLTLNSAKLRICYDKQRFVAFDKLFVLATHQCSIFWIEFIALCYHPHTLHIVICLLKIIYLSF
jgi:hypothetical protein